MRKGVPFQWEDQHTQALDCLIHMVTTVLVLGCPDLERQYFLEVDVSAFALGGVLFQYNEAGRQQDVTYFSKALTPPERNYDIWDREFLAIVAVLRHWRHLLVGTRDPMVVLTDHTNLQYYRHPQKINQRVARYISFLEDFNYQLKHIPSVRNHADALSRRPDHDDGTDDNEQVTALPDDVFVRVVSMTILDESFKKQQRRESGQLEAWQSRHGLEQKHDDYCYKGSALVAIGGEEDK